MSALEFTAANSMRVSPNLVMTFESQPGPYKSTTIDRRCPCSFCHAGRKLGG